MPCGFGSQISLYEPGLDITSEFCHTYIHRLSSLGFPPAKLPPPDGARKAYKSASPGIVERTITICMVLSDSEPTSIKRREK
jgi:hypothetical protein